MSISTENERFCGPGVASRILGVSTTSVRDFVARGDLPAIKTEDNRSIFRMADVERLAAERAGAKS